MKLFTKHGTILAAVFTFGLFAVAAQTTIPGGPISGHWTLAGSPYQITGAVYIPDAATLTIDPGVSVIFMTTFQLPMLVEGQLLAIGSPGDSITFTANDTTSGFRGIRFADSYYYTGNDTSKLEYCKIQYSNASGSSYLYENGGALFFDNWSLAIVSHCLISHCKANTGGGQNGGAIFCDSSSNPILTYNTITHNYGAGNGGGIFCNDSSSPLISHNTIMYNNGGNSGGGIYCNNSRPAISFNIISNDVAIGGGGIFIDANSNPLISNNTVSYNTANNPSGAGYGGGIYCNSSGKPFISYNNVSYNTISPGTNSNACGGGIYCNTSSSPVISDNFISYNSTNVNAHGNGSSFGGGIYCNTSCNAVISFDTISQNTAVGGNGSGFGGGIYCNSSCSPVISHNSISSNFTGTNSTSANSYGGAIFCNSLCHPVLSYNYVASNAAGNFVNYIYNNTSGICGGIYCTGCIISSFNNNTIYGNYAYDDDNFYYNAIDSGGGGLFCSACTITSFNNNIITSNVIGMQAGYFAGSGGGAGTCFFSTNISSFAGNTISGNTAYGSIDSVEGGGIYLMNSTITTFTGNSVSGNKASGNNLNGDGFGGGIFLLHSTITSFSNDTISYNDAGYSVDGGISGGGIYCGGSSAIKNMSNSVIANNYTLGDGGGIWTENSAIDTISNTSIINNTAAGNGGGFYCSGDSPFVLNVTMANNNASQGGALFCDVVAKPNFYNCIFWSDSASTLGGGNEMFQNDQPSSPNFYYSDVKGGSSGFGLGPYFYSGTYLNNINANPLFVSPSAGIGSGFDGVKVNWELQTGSPCIDEGDPLAPNAPNYNYPAIDLAANPRIVVCRIDMGAYENQYGVSSPLQIIVSGRDSLCTPGSTTLAASGATSYIWTPNTGLSCYNCPSPIASPTASTTYTIVGSSGTCEGISTFRMVVNPTPKITFSGNDTTCYGTPANITATGGDTYLWSNTETSASISVTPPHTTTYTVIVTNQGCTHDSTFTVNVNPLPVVTFTGNDSTCYGIPDSITASGGGTYLWNNSSTTATISFIPTTSVIYSVAITNHGCITDSTFSLTVNQLPVLSISQNNDTLFISGAKTYLWNTGSTYDTTVIHTSGTYYVTATDSNGCISLDSIKVVISGMAGINNSLGDVTVYPNPSAGIFTISFSHPELVSASQTITVFNVLGQPVFTEILRSAQDANLIDLSAQPNGIYLYRVIANTGNILGEGKLVIQK